MRDVENITIAELRRYAISQGEDDAASWTANELREFWAAHHAEDTPVERHPEYVGDETPKGDTPDAPDAPLGGLSKEKQAALDVLLGGAGGISEARVIELIESRGTKRVEVRDVQGEVVKLDVVHESFEELLTMIQCKRNVFMVGPAGCGKTTLGEQVAKALKRDFYFTGAVTAEHKILGFTDGYGKYQETQFYHAYRDGGVFLFDEMDASLPAAVLSFNAALSGNWADFPAPIGKVARHPDFIAIAAGNTYGRGANRQYVGRMQQDGAALDRFVDLTLDYDEKLESIIALAEYRAFGGTDDAVAKSYIKLVQRLRKKATTAELEIILSPRASMNGCALLAGGLAQDQVMDSCIIKGLDVDTRRTLGLTGVGE